MSFLVYSLASFSECGSVDRRRTGVADRSRRGGGDRSGNAAFTTLPGARGSIGRERSAETVGATSNTLASPRSWLRFTRFPQAAKTPSRRCQKPAVDGLSESRTHERSAPHLKPWSELTIS